MSTGLLATGVYAQIPSLGDLVVMQPPIPPREVIEEVAVGELAGLIYRSLPEAWRARTSEAQIATAVERFRQEIVGAVRGGPESPAWKTLWPALLNDVFADQAAVAQADLQQWLDLLARSLGIEDGRLILKADAKSQLVVFFAQGEPPPPETIFATTPPKPREIRTILRGNDFRLGLDLKGVDGRGTFELRDPVGGILIDGLGYDSRERDYFSGPVKARFSSAQMWFDKWTMKDGAGEVEQPHVGLNLGFIRMANLYADRIEFDNGQAVARRVRLQFLGIPVYRKSALAFEYPTRFELGSSDTERVNDTLIEEVKLLRPPSVSFRGRDPKVSYSNSYQSGNRWNASVSFDAVRGEFPTSSVEMVWNLSREPDTSLSILSESFLRQEIGGMFTANPSIRTVLDRSEQLRAKRFNLHAGTAFNTVYPILTPGSPFDRDVISFPFYAGVEVGGPIGPFGGSVQFRFNQVDDRVFGREGRWGAIGSFGVARGPILRGLTYDVVVDGSIFNPGPERFAWVRPSAELHFRFFPWLRVSTGFSHWQAFGAPPTPFDDIPIGNQLHGRVDFLLGPLQLSYANSYRVRDKAWYRSRVYISQVIGAWRLTLTTDQQFRGFGIGLGLRVDEILDGLNRRRPTGVRLETVP